MYLFVLSENLKTSLRSRKGKGSVLTNFVTAPFYYSLTGSFSAFSRRISRRSLAAGEKIWRFFQTMYMRLERTGERGRTARPFPDSASPAKVRRMAM